ncbi:uncharacterized protein TRAVEDRAFT_55873 [Trametes versicolor FP-101664 SS1]|uniref:uncharacterized protein n=1 Tax=Trametes versicolor (strain FP-101664) TaxID=717944 RepID=UPI0004622D0F|nr:uncharacterized protein TRAVEDRAFT_55873 [Trametes versicolor FP-101664 SS1]EIW65278.1 hypothetical protein TRAVEDRAFT_55873 [Trametes versicolor FP-101664 SS1]
MVNAMLSVKSGQGQPLVNPGDGRWLIVQLPYGQALSPTSHVPVPAGEYEISLRQQGLDCYPRPEIQQLNWDKEDKTKRDPNFATLIRNTYGQCVVTGTPYRVDMHAAHICPVSTNFKIWDWLAQYAFHEDVQMTTQFLHSASNGVLLRADIHTAFDAYAITVIQDPNEWWSWQVLAVDPAFAGNTGMPFAINRPADDGDRKRLVCSLQMHFIYATQKYAGAWFPV